jgi:hypothetical protein
VEVVDRHPGPRVDRDRVVVARPVVQRVPDPERGGAQLVDRHRDPHRRRAIGHLPPVGHVQLGDEQPVGEPAQAVLGGAVEEQVDARLLQHGHRTGVVEVPVRVLVGPAQRHLRDETAH